VVIPDLRRELQFGIFVTPQAAHAEAVLELAILADVLGLDLVSFQDHPYQARFLDTWTLLSVVAARTANVHVAPNVANLPLRPPAVLARSVASLDILSGGRVELGLGAGAFWDGVTAMGGRRLTPGQSVDALSEAVDVIRQLWSQEAGSVRFEGEHYRVVGAHRGPPPVHPVEIWLGAYKPRMLALTGAKADGWLPSLGYADPAELAAMGARIDEAAERAGRRAADVRRVYNINGEFGSGSGFLQGPPAAWAEQLAALTFEAGISTFILSVASEGERRCPEARAASQPLNQPCREMTASAISEPGTAVSRDLSEARIAAGLERPGQPRRGRRGVAPRQRSTCRRSDTRPPANRDEHVRWARPWRLMSSAACVPAHFETSRRSTRGGWGEGSRAPRSRSVASGDGPEVGRGGLSWCSSISEETPARPVERASSSCRGARAVASEATDLGVVDERVDPGGNGHVVAEDLASVETGLVPMRIIEARS
jgi:hypothetical protein